MAVANSEHRSRIAPPRIIRCQSLVNVLLGQIEPPLLNPNRSIRELRPRPQQAAKVGAADAQLAGGVRDVDGVPALNLNANISVQVLNAVGNLGPSDKVAHSHSSPAPFSNCSTAARRSTIRLRLNASSNSPARQASAHAADEVAPAQSNSTGQADEAQSKPCACLREKTTRRENEDHGP
jgi:hypothetical protein